MIRILKKLKNRRNKELDTPEIRSAIVRLAHKIPSNTSKGKIVKIGEVYFVIKELG